MALENEHSQSSVGERRGQRLAPLQTNFSRPTSRPLLVTSPRTQRPRPEEFENGEEHNERVPLQPTPVKRQSSKSGLRGLFGREKTARKPPSDAKLSGIDEVQPSAPKGEPGPAAPLSPISSSTPVAVPSSATEHHRAKTPSKSRGRQSEDKPGSDDTAWKPPPLFQAFPQAIRHDTLPCPGLSVDSILRFHATSAAKSGHARDEDHAAQHSKGAGAEDPTVRKKKEDKEKRKHLRTLSDTIGKTEWSQKIYVLTTSGYILQYSGGGKHDRLPEKMLQLGPKSVAFASDAIPGKHWVLQVSQSSEDQPTTSTDTHRPLLSRFGFHRSHAKRLARSFLLVFHTPEDLSSWLLAVRAQIEARGGKKYVTERVFDDDMEHQLHSQTSARQLVRKDPNRFSQTFLQPQQSIGSDEQESTPTDQSRRSSHVSAHRRSVVLPSAPESRSESISTTHTEVTSPVSGNGQGRFYSSVSPGGVPISPPKNEKSAISTVLSALDSSASPTSSTPRKRQSLNLQQAATTAETPEIPRSQSVAPDPLLRSASPPAPNFSVPSFSQRFAAKTGPSRLSHMPGPRRGSDMPLDPAEIMSTFSSPPQSPGKPPSNFGPGYSNEQQLSSHDTPRKPLRVSNSEDSLADPQRGQEPKPHRHSRIPMNNMAAPPTTSHSSRPLSTIKHEAVESRINAPLPPLPPGATDPSPHRDQKRNRTSVLHRADSGGRPTGPPMPRRKSMPGLTVVGPPSVPPPNCPLPKIPSPVDPAAHDWPEPPTSDPRAGTPSRPSRKFRLSSMPHPPTNGRTTPSGQRSASRQSRLPVN